MEFQKIRTWLALLLALMLNIVWASGNEWVLCMRGDGNARVALASAHACNDVHRAAEHHAEECVESDCDDLPIGETMPVVGRRPVGKKRPPSASSSQFPGAGLPARYRMVQAGAEPTALPHSLACLRTVILRL